MLSSTHSAVVNYKLLKHGLCWHNTYVMMRLAVREGRDGFREREGTGTGDKPY
jgi:hypothetical protein